MLGGPYAIPHQDNRTGKCQFYEQCYVGTLPAPISRRQRAIFVGKKNPGAMGRQGSPSVRDRAVYAGFP
jgi:hypothetical protein